MVLEPANTHGRGIRVIHRIFDLLEPSVRGRTERRRPFGHSSSMSLPIDVNMKSKKPGAGERSEYLIDGFRVSFLHQAEWKCACAEFCAAGTCRHTREATGMRDAQARIRTRLGSQVRSATPSRMNLRRQR
jgi:hypothetical protein